MPVAAYPSTVKIPGTSTAFTAEPCTVVAGTGNLVYQINTAIKRVVDPAVAVVVKDNAVTQGASVYTFDYLFGKIAFLTPPTAPVTVDASYLPMLTLAEVREFGISASATMLDKSNFDAGGAKVKLAGLKDFDATLETLQSPFYDNDAGGGTQKLDALHSNGTPVLLEIRPGGSGDYFRGWALIESFDLKGSTDGLIPLSLSLKGSARPGLGQTEGAAFAWGQ